MHQWPDFNCVYLPVRESASLGEWSMDELVD